MLGPKKWSTNKFTLLGVHIREFTLGPKKWSTNKFTLVEVHIREFMLGPEKWRQLIHIIG